MQNTSSHLTPYTTQNLTTPHGFFTRNGGVSDGPFATLNCGIHTGEVTFNVLENRKRVCQYFGASSEALCLVVQRHTTDIIVVDDVSTYKKGSPPVADALITRDPNAILGVLTADCAPVLMHDPVEKIVAAVHAGWRGAVFGIIERTAEKMVAMGTSIENLQIAVGPCLGKQNFEVKEDFIAEFKKNVKLDARDYILVTSGQYHFDFKKFIADKIKICGIWDAHICEIDTYDETNLYFSYRRKTHANGASFGNQISCIKLNN
jgi:YfiH family protein